MHQFWISPSSSQGYAFPALLVMFPCRDTVLALGDQGRLQALGRSSCSNRDGQVYFQMLLRRFSATSPESVTSSAATPPGLHMAPTKRVRPGFAALTATGVNCRKSISFEPLRHSIFCQKRAWIFLLWSLHPRKVARRGWQEMEVEPQNQDPQGGQKRDSCSQTEGGRRTRNSSRHTKGGAATGQTSRSAPERVPGQTGPRTGK